MLNQGNRQEDIDTIASERQMLSARLNPLNPRFDETGQIIAVRIHSQEDMRTAQESRDAAQAAAQIYHESSFLER